jgi:RND family efflux transporter MFP subunit
MRLDSIRFTLATLLTPVLMLAQPPAALAQGGPPPAQVYVDRARVMEVETRRETTGDLRPVRRAVVASREEGRVVEFDLREGQRVEEGDVLARLDDDLLRYEVDRARAQTTSDQGRIDERRAELENARRDLERLEDLSERGSARPVELDDARTETARIAAQLAQAEADLAVSRAELARAERRLRDATIRAPFGGRVVSTMTELGEWIDSGGSVAELITLDELEVWLDVPESALQLVRGSDVSLLIRVDALAIDLEAPVAAIIPDVDPLSRLFPVRVAIDNEDERLAPGMSVTGLTPTGVRGEVLTVHGDSVRVDDLGEYVYYDRGGVAGVARVRTLYRVGDRVVVRPGAIEPGDRVIVEGNERLFPGQPLTILGEGSPASRVGRGENPTPPAPDREGGGEAG